MPNSSKSSVRGTPRPVNVFYVWYGEVCRRLNTTPLSIVKPPKPKSSTILDFVCDRIKAEEWTPVLNALEKDTSLHVIAIRSRANCKFLPEVDTEEKVRRMKRRYGCLFTAYILRTLIKSVSSVLKKSSVLTCLELDGLPITIQYLEPLLQGLKKNSNVRVLSLQHCPIGDIGCQQLCLSLRYMPNIEILNLSGCELGSMSAEYLAKVIKLQQINRYCESWHNSLRYEEPEVGNMKGLKRITLNCNQNIGDEGLIYIIDELEDDLWIKALDMQKCGVTDAVSCKIVDLVEYSRSLEVADFRHNEKLSDATVEKILEILSRKQAFGYQAEFQWCLTTSTLCYDSSNENASCKSYNSKVQKSKSAPFKPVLSSKPSESLRRTKTTINMKKRPIEKVYNNISMTQAKKECVELNCKLQKEIAKREEIQRVNEMLKQKLETIRSSVGSIGSSVKQSNSKLMLPNMSTERTNKNINPPKIEEVIFKTNGFVRPSDKIQETKINQPNGVRLKNGLNGFKKPLNITIPNIKTEKAQQIFEGLLYKGGGQQEDEDFDMGGEYSDLGYSLKSKSRVAMYLEDSTDKSFDELSASNISLQRFIREMQHDEDDCLEANLDSSRPTTNSTSRTVVSKEVWNGRTTNRLVKVR